MKKLLTVFKPDFTAVFTAQLTGAFNDNLFRTAFATFTAYRLIGLRPGQVSFFIIAALTAYMLPYFLFSVLAGEIADKFPKPRIIRIIKLTEIITVLLIAVGFYFKSPNFLLFVLFIMGVQSAFLGPVKYSILPQIMEKNQLISANALMEAGRYLAIMLGTFFGIFLAQYKGIILPGAIMLLAAVAGFAVTFLFGDYEPQAPSTRIHANIFKSVWRNVNLAYRNEQMFLCIMGIAWFWVIGSVILSQLPDLSENTLHANAKVFNYLLALFSVGIGAGALLCHKLLKGDISVKYIPASALLMSCALIDLVFVFLRAPVMGIRISVDLFVISMCAGFYIVPLNAMLQSIGLARMRSRMIAVSNLLNALFMVVASVISLTLLHFGLGAPAVIGLLAISNLVVAIYILQLLPDYMMRSAIFFILNFVYDIKVKGIENYQNAPKRTVILANNNSFLDPLLLAAYLPDDLTFVVDSTIASRFWVRKILRFFKHIAIDHANPMAVKTIIEEIKKGRRIVLYPEGRITTTGSLMKIYPGPAMIADRSGADVLPIFMSGTQYSRFAYFGRKLRHIPDVPFVINIMPAIKLNIPGQLKGKDRRYKAEDKVYDLMTDMKFRSSNYNQTIFRSLIEAADFAGHGRRALEDIERKGLSFGKVVIGSFMLGRQLAKHVEHGKNIGVLLPTTNACALTILGLSAYGRVPAVINFSSGVKNILSACKAADLKKLITARAVIEKGGEMIAEIIKAVENSGIEIIYLEDIKNQITTVDKLYALWQGMLPYRAYRKTNPKPDPGSPAVILFTSGSEGVPKGVAVTHRGINTNRVQLACVTDVGLQDKFFNALPMFHSFGLVCGTLIPLLSGVSVFLYPTPLHYKIIPELVYDRNATAFFGTDTFLNAYAKSAHPYDFYSVRFAAVGAEKLKDETFKLWSEKFGIRVLEAYGATEMSPGISFTTPLHFKRGTVGRLFPGLEHRLEPVPGVDAGGCLVLKGPNIMAGYLTDAAPGVLVPPADGWYNTGDIVNIDDDGYLTIVGRAKRFAKIAGEMVSLGAVEAALFKLWPDDMHGVIRLPDEKRGEQLYLYTTRRTADIKQIQEAFRAQGLPELWVPRSMEVLEALPLMGSGKVDYVKLEALPRPN